MAFASPATAIPRTNSSTCTGRTSATSSAPTLAVASSSCGGINPNATFNDPTAALFALGTTASAMGRMQVSPMRTRKALTRLTWRLLHDPAWSAPLSYRRKRNAAPSAARRARTDGRCALFGCFVIAPSAANLGDWAETRCGEGPETSFFFCRLARDREIFGAPRLLRPPHIICRCSASARRRRAPRRRARLCSSQGRSKAAKRCDRGRQPSRRRARQKASER